MAALIFLVEEALQEEGLERRNKRRRTRESFSINLVPDVEFISNYRLSRALFEEFCQEIVPLLPERRNRRGIDPALKILVALNFYARGSYQGSVGQNYDMPMAQQTISRCLKQVTDAINTPSILQKYIKFPQNECERGVIRRKFYQLYNIPGVIGCIDCTHVAIVRPREHEERFFNRKHFHSINTQVICDSDCIILNVDASYGGATHDSFIWSQSEIKGHLESLPSGTACLLGDSGYPLREYLLIPIGNAVEESPEGHFNEVHRHARSTIERTFGILKGRWRCLLAARELHYHPETAGKIILACCVLHNICMRAGLDAPQLTEDDLQAERSRQITSEPVMSLTTALRRGQRVRESVVQLLDRSSRR